MGARRKSREYALQALYLSDITQLSAAQAIKIILSGDDIEPKTKSFAEWITHGAAEKKTELDEIITLTAANWEMERMAALDRNILRMGAYELLYEKDTPPSVIIDEAVEIAKAFSTPDSSKFVNGILDKIKKDRHPSKE